MPLLGPDEPRYAEVAREMFVSHDFISPRLCGCLWVEKPALYYWMAAGSYALLGVNELAARVPSALSAIGCLAFLFYGLRRRISSRFAFFVCLALASGSLFVGFARAAVTDMALTAGITVALMAFYLAVTGVGRERVVFWLIACAATGAAVLAKGLVGVVLFALIVLISLAFAREWPLGWRDLITGSFVFLAVCATWYGPVIARHGWPFIQDFFINHHFKRYLTNEFHHPEPIYFYPFVMLAGLFPWTFYLIPAAAGIRPAIRSNSPRTRLLVILAWTWLLTPLLFFSISESKLPSYILPAFPGAAILIGIELDRVWARTSRKSLALANWLTSILIACLAAALPFYIYLHPIRAGAMAGILEWLPLTLALVSLVLLALGKARQWFVCLALFMPVLLMVGLKLVLPEIERTVGLKDLSLTAAEALRPGEKIAFYLDKQYAPVFYARGSVMCGGKASDVLDARNTSDIIDALSSGAPSLIVFTRSEWIHSLTQDHRLSFESIGTQHDQAAFRVILRTSSGSP